MTAKIHPELRWHNGDPVTADDVVTNHKLRFYTKTISTFRNFVSRESISKTGEKSFKIQFDDTFEPSIVKIDAVQGLGWLNSDVFRSFLERFDEASSDDEHEKVASDLAKEEITWDDADDHGTGLFRHKETTRQRVALERWDDHYWSDRVNWDDMEFVWTAEGQMLPNLQNEKYTSVVAKGITSMDEAESVPDSYMTNRQLGTGGWCLVFQHDDEIFGNRKVRQALAHISDTETVAKNAGEFRNAAAPERITGMVPEIEDEYIGDIKDAYTVYDKGPEEATKLLQEAGFTMDGGEWYQPDGNRFSAKIKAPTTPQVFSNTGRSFASQARKFGIDLQVVALEVSNYWSDFPGGSFRLAIGFWASGKTVHPYRALGRTIRGNRVPSQGANITLQGVKAPPVGEPDGEPQTYNLRDAFKQASQGKNFDEQIRKISWVYNHIVPVVPGTQRYRGSFHMTDGWSWPGADSDLWKVTMGTAETSQGTGAWPVWSGNVEAQTE